MKLLSVEIQKYKSFEDSQSFELDEKITILVGMNESGKTSALEAIAKTNYFQRDDDFEFSTTHDYPRKLKKKMDKSGEDPVAISCKYEIDDDLYNSIEAELGVGVLKGREVTIETKYSGQRVFILPKVDNKAFIETKTDELGIKSKALTEKLLGVKDPDGLDKVRDSYSDESYIDGLNKLRPYFEKEWKNWHGFPLNERIARVHIAPNLPKFLYYDEYFSLPSRISIEKLKDGQLDENEDKTAKALIELADIDLEELVNANNFEDFVAELEATEAIISDELFKYWGSNNNLQIVFQIDKQEETNPNTGTRIVEHILDIRVKSKGVSLPLKNRSRGFNWFFSFLVWFKKIQEDGKSDYILLLDEPGLNLHASAQADLLRFLEDLSSEYQVIYTTHSPFMIPSGELNRIRTVLETDKGSVISDSVQEKDPNTLFPLQAALGYDIAQNLFVSKKNLLVEGVSDLMILSVMSGLLESMGRMGLRSDVTIVPTGGLEKVATFISLLRGSNLEIACLLDSYLDKKNKAKLEKMITEKLIHKNKIRFFDEFVDTNKQADIEDLFSKDEYIKLFNSAFSELNDLSLSDLNISEERIIVQINEAIGKDRFNHYRPAKELTTIKASNLKLSSETLDRFENLFKSVNKLFD